MDEASELTSRKKVRRVGYWMTEKKIRRLNFEAFERLCRNSGIDIVKINFRESLDNQGPFDLILHKLTDLLARTQEGSQEAVRQIEMVQQYVLRNPGVSLIDPIENVLMLLDRRKQYEYVRECDIVDDDFHYFIPSFTELTTSDINENRQRIADGCVHYPIVCKPSLSHCSGIQQTNTGPVEREEMAIIFSEAGLADIEPPCVVQTFVNHNARLFKIFIVGSRYFIIKRPSIKNFYAGEKKTIFFNSNDVSKSYSSCFLNIMEESEVAYPIIEPDERKLVHLVAALQKKFGLDLLGVDVIIENVTGRYAVIDINVFPGYDGVHDFFPALLDLIQQKLDHIPRQDIDETTLKLEPGSNNNETTAARSEDHKVVENGDSGGCKSISDSGTDSWLYSKKPGPCSQLVNDAANITNTMPAINGFASH